MNMHTNKAIPDQKIPLLKPHLPKALADINELCQKCLECYCNSINADNDLRKTIFAKFYLLLVNFALHLELVREENHLKDIIDKLSLFNVNADYLENFFKFAMRSLYSESIELVDHLLASILESQGVKIDKFWKFNKMLAEMVKQVVISPEEESFLQKWMNEQRNPRHRNFEDFYAGGKPISYSFPHDFSNFDRLVDIIQKLTTHSLIKQVSFVADRNPR